MLFYHHLGRPLAQEFEVGVVCLFDEVGLNQDTLQRIKPGLQALLAMPLQSIGGEVFQYRFLVAHDHPEASTWLLEFYEGIAWMAWTLPRRDIAARPQFAAGSVQ